MAEPSRVRRGGVWLFCLAAVTAVIVLLAASSSSGPRRPASGAGTSRPGVSPATAHPARSQAESSRRFAVGIRLLKLIDRSRRIRLPNGGSTERPLLTYVWYPASGAPGRGVRGAAPPARDPGRFPLVIFGHGFAVTPERYAQLLQAWTTAGYVVAAPRFPLSNAQAPGGPDEADLVNQPADMRYVISRLLSASAAPSGPLSGLIDPSAIAVAGHSDGGETALAAAYDTRYRDPRVDAALILSGAELPGPGFTFPARSPPLLVTQGTADGTHPASFSIAFFELAPRPRYLLTLLGAGHLTPYTAQQPQLAVVQRVTVAFLDRYLKRRPDTLPGIQTAGVARLEARP